LHGNSGTAVGTQEHCPHNLLPPGTVLEKPVQSPETSVSDQVFMDRFAASSDPAILLANDSRHRQAARKKQEGSHRFGRFNAAHLFGTGN
jgi:hypothetical protein